VELYLFFERKSKKSDSWCLHQESDRFKT